MASGLTRRRGGAGASNGDNEDGETSRVASPAPKGSSSRDVAPETSYESSENGHKIAFDPRDISESAERSKQPKLTLMEEILLLGLKDKQVRNIFKSHKGVANCWIVGLSVILE
jgi:Golgi phosphoprotein 3